MYDRPAGRWTGKNGVRSHRQVSGAFVARVVIESPLQVKAIAMHG
ncbi:hypothetical protein SAMN04489859_103319 [Paracoccus alcaliphilus]|uniref:Uncharacterized protein n=1 Tax=Paracoccus alcaliphilus TaxID=34002 RepID=A0A1H8LRH7_9RHOB|nr:hypothetical protein SAMN04489859_103319 [Paracoccus alcaliphilus]